MNEANKTRFHAIVCALIELGHIYPVGIISEFHVDFDANEEGKRRIVQAAMTCDLVEVDSIVGNVLQFEISHLDCAVAIANGDDMPGLGAELARKVRAQIYRDFETLEYMSGKELWYAFKNHSKHWDRLYAEWDAAESFDEDANAIRDAEQSAAARGLAVVRTFESDFRKVFKEDAA